MTNEDAASKAQRELEQHICPAVRELLTIARDLVDRMDRLEICTRTMAGRLERWELHQVAHDRTYPLTQAHIVDLQARRAELARRVRLTDPEYQEAPSDAG